MNIIVKKGIIIRRDYELIPVYVNKKGEEITDLWFQKYRIIRVIGTGGTATVFLAEHEKLQCYRAIKRISKNNRFHEQFMNEARILKNLKHPNIPAIYDLEEDNEYSYIIEEFIEGQSLKAFRLCQSNFQEEHIIRFAIQICDLFQYLHAMEFPILYLDLKPDNILLQDNTLKLVDFGSAVFREEAANQAVSFGTRGYAAPEQYTVGCMDERSDIYGIGILLLFLVTAKPYHADQNKELVIREWVGCSKRLGRTIEKCLKEVPSQRFQNVVQLKEELLTLHKTEVSDCRIKSKKSLTIVIAGSQNRIGTTHVGLLITSYINQYLEPAIFVEHNANPVLPDILEYNKDRKKAQEILCRKQCHLMIGSDHQEGKHLEHYQVKVCDYGVLTTDNLERFSQGDIKLLVLGTKEWELSYAHRTLKELLLCEDVYYLFNFTDGRGFIEARSQMGKERCLRVPYYPDPYEVSEQGVVKEFMEAFFQERKNEKTANFIEKHLWFKRTKK